MKGFFAYGACLLAAALILAGCAHQTPAPQTGRAPASGPPPQPGQIFIWGQDAPLSEKDLSAALVPARVVLVGETHDHPGHHAAQLRILQLMNQQGPPPVVGIEWLDHQAQAACDALAGGSVTVEEFARLADWDARWGYPLDLYRPILEYVRQHKLKLVAMNAPLKVVRKLARQGFQALSAAERGQLAPALDLHDPAYAEMIARQFQGHGVEGKEAQSNFMAAQIARDETMAHHLAADLYPWPDGGKKAVVLVGSAHLAHGRGLPPRLERRLPGVKLITFLPVSSDKMEMARQELPEAEGPADYIMVTEPAPPRPPRLGIMVRGAREGLLVEGVWPQGEAFKAGLRKGDIIRAVDGKPLQTPKDIHDAIKAAPYEPHTYQVLRGGKDLALTITLPKAKPASLKRPRE
ncbi:hypothetical protein AAU61_17940 [Desulfocarbo indianensis]|nr:hypothetical protein AAU61_17940 [Desulfocarbo indianensis]